MNFLQKLNGGLSKEKALLPVLYNNGLTTTFRTVGEGVTLYPLDSGQTYIDKGYKLNPVVYAIISASAKKFAQIPFYHYKIRSTERKTWQEYQALTKTRLDQKAISEALKMRTKAVEQTIVDSQLSKKLAKPNRNMSGSDFRESLYTYKFMTGEANQWISRGFDDRGGQITSGKPNELHIIPKANLLMVKGQSAWDVSGYKIAIGGDTFNTPKDNILMWVTPNPESMIDGQNLSHLRGFAPLESARHILQAFNEGAERLVNINHNQGAAGIAYNKEMGVGEVTPDQSMFIRSQFDNIVNNKSMLGKIAMLGGEWGFHQFGMNVGELQMLEQMDKQTEILCNVLGYPPGLLTKNQTHDNQDAAEKRWIYGTIAPAAYSLRDLYNEQLLPAYDLDRDLNVIDCDVTVLPELSDDLKYQVEALKDAWWLSVDEKRTASGYDALNSTESQKIYVPGSLTSLDEAGAPIDYED